MLSPGLWEWSPGRQTVANQAWNESWNERPGNSSAISAPGAIRCAVYAGSGCAV
jgi:hypothetical protein